MSGEAGLYRSSVIRFDLLDKWEESSRRGVDTLLTHARALDRIVKRFPTNLHESALMLIWPDRIYCFEQNPRRWPDGRWYMLDRGYDFWRGYRISFTREELVELGVEKWVKSRAIVAGFDDDMLPMASDCFQYNPRRWLSAYAKLVGRIALAHEARVDAAGGQA